MKTTKHGRSGGFTLIEIMMAMAIFALVLTAIYAVWTLILKSSKLGMAAAAQVQRERISVRVIEDALISTRSFAADLQHYAFIAENGDEATLSFVARLPKSFPRSGKFGDFDVRRLTFSVESRLGSGRQLVLRQNPILMDVDVDEKEHPLVLAKGVNKLLFEFWDVRLNDWVDEWTQTNQLPKLVKVTVQFVEPNQHGSYSQRKEEVTRIVALPSITVPANLQMPGVPGRPPPPP
ncbi:MAG TPA: prepilin-type N-terminal cleavage/methylation domain-containing protein [Verrucomicrobiae bacterium]|nr:prepilin-type N-terminal cleavage/methylation domain-containing protein [Verrucomicrobiae bacterium]